MSHLIPTGGHSIPVSMHSTPSGPVTWKSKLKKIGPVTFPPFRGERVYMLPFMKHKGLPPSLTHWQPTVYAMLKGIESDRYMYLMIDQSRVMAGRSQRRPGPHVDGNWIDYDNPPNGRVDYPETIVLASDVVGCKAFLGKFTGSFGVDGDCSWLDLSKMKEVILQANEAYAGNVTMVHESIPISYNCERTLVRINVPHHVL